MRKRIIWTLVLLVLVLVSLSPQIVYQNSGVSKSLGKVHKGSLQNAYRLEWKQGNTVFFSKFSYYILCRAYVNSNVYHTIYEAHNALEKLYPKRKFIVMECSHKKGGRMYPHRTHQNGLSVDFFTPLTKKNKPKNFKVLGYSRYLLNFDNEGKRKNVEIDFDAMAEHILMLEKHARKNNLRIKKVIFRTDLKDELYESKHGKELKKSGIYLAMNLTPQLNKLHDDHYHIDFEIID